jgi:small conductance mechanosensitive channel
VISDFLASSKLDGWDLLLALVIVIVGWIAASLAKRGTAKLVRRIPGVTDATVTLVARIVRYGMLLLTLGIVLTVLGAPLQPVLAAALIIIAIGVIALRGVASNFGAGLVIQIRRVVHVGDEIEVLDHQGIVTELNGRSVIIHTAEGTSVRLPNSSVLDSPLINYTERALFRSELEVRVRGERPWREAHDLIVSTLGATEHVRSVPSVEALLAVHSPTQSTYRVRFWHEPRHRGELRAGAAAALADAFTGAGIDATVAWPVPPPPLTPPPDL